MWDREREYLAHAEGEARAPMALCLLRDSRRAWIHRGSPRFSVWHCGARAVDSRMCVSFASFVCRRRRRAIGPHFQESWIMVGWWKRMREQDRARLTNIFPLSHIYIYIYTNTFMVYITHVMINVVVIFFSLFFCSL